jgi:hydroxymethylglutaryl-CoA lyase
MFRNISFAGRTSTVSGTLRESKSFKEQKYSTFSNENGTSHISNKVIVSMEESSF